MGTQREVINSPLEIRESFLEETVPEFRPERQMKIGKNLLKVGTVSVNDSVKVCWESIVPQAPWWAPYTCEQVIVLFPLS